MLLYITKCVATKEKQAKNTQLGLYYVVLCYCCVVTKFQQSSFFQITKDIHQNVCRMVSRELYIWKLFKLTITLSANNSPEQCSISVMLSIWLFILNSLKYVNMLQELVDFYMHSSILGRWYVSLILILGHAFQVGTLKLLKYHFFLQFATNSHTVT